MFLFPGPWPSTLALAPSPSPQPQFVFGGPGHHLYLAALASSCIYWPWLIRIGNNNVSILCYYLYFNGSCIEMKQKVIEAKNRVTSKTIRQVKQKKKNLKSTELN